MILSNDLKDPEKQRTGFHPSGLTADYSAIVWYNKLIENYSETKKISKEKTDLLEFLGPNMNDNGYTRAKYRINKSGILLQEETDLLSELIVPTYLEALRNNDLWTPHPIVFKHYGSYDAQKEGEGLLIVFLLDGKYTFFDSRREEYRKLSERAKLLGLTEGETIDLKVFRKIED